jgi:RNA polymerase sigma-70 factor (ECF subfamily)
VQENEVENNLVWKEYRALLKQALGQLSEQQRRIYGLSRGEGKSYMEIAEALQISVNTVKFHMKEALRSIRDYLSQHAADLTILFLLLFH